MGVGEVREGEFLFLWPRFGNKRSFGTGPTSATGQRRASGCSTKHQRGVVWTLPLRTNGRDKRDSAEPRDTGHDVAGRWGVVTGEGGQDIEVLKGFSPKWSLDFLS